MSLYPQAFYDQIEAGAASSAAIVVPVLMDLFSPTTVVDVGCGQGVWLAEFYRHGCEVRGFDGLHVDRRRLAIRSDCFETVDLDTERIASHADLVMSLEVAEHIPESRAKFLVADLCATADVVLFSAATPGQGGVGHINEQWPAYWVEKFERQGFKVSGALRWQFWSQVPEVENWYAQNLLVAVKHPDRFPDLFAGPWCEPFGVIHPRQWAAHAGQVWP
jgi:SAM-dependent methyltransferase